MKHRSGFNQLNRVPAHRKALIRNQMTVLFKCERIVTTHAKALETRRAAEKLITRAKVDSVHNRRIAAKKIQDEAVLAKLFTDIGPRFVNRAGGYTRILRIGDRANDAADMVILELVDYKLEDKKAAKDKKKADKKAKAEKKASTEKKAAAEEKPKDEGKKVEGTKKSAGAGKKAAGEKPAAEKKTATAKKAAPAKKAAAPKEAESSSPKVTASPAASSSAENDVAEDKGAAEPKAE